MRILMSLGLAFVVTLANAAHADWARDMFQQTDHNFGAVARASNTEYRFEFQNRTNQTVHVRSVRTSCNCTTPIIETESVEPGGIGSILARFNTRSHTGQRQATVTVTFDRPQFSEVQLMVRGYIRTDIVLDPGEADFGNVAEGQSHVKTLEIQYAGRSDWAITGITTPAEFMKAKVEEVSRGGGRVQYKMYVGLDDFAPSGPLMSELTVHTNDRNLTSFPLRIIANVEAPISVSPQLLSMGDVKPGEEFKQVLIVKSQSPFIITNIESESFDLEFDIPDKPKKIHTLPVKVRTKANAKNRPEEGDFRGTILITTDLPGDTQVKLDAVCKVREE